MTGLQDTRLVSVSGQYRNNLNVVSASRELLIAFHTYAVDYYLGIILIPYLYSQLITDNRFPRDNFTLREFPINKGKILLPCGAGSELLCKMCGCLPAF